MRTGLSYRIAISTISVNCRSFLSLKPTLPGLMRYLASACAQPDDRQGVVADIVEIHVQRHIDAKPQQALVDARHGGGTLVAIDRDAHDLGAGAVQCCNLRTSWSMSAVSVLVIDMQRQQARTPPTTTPPNRRRPTCGGGRERRNIRSCRQPFVSGEPGVHLTHKDTPGRCAEVRHEVEEQRWLVNGDRSTLAGIGPPRDRKRDPSRDDRSGFQLSGGSPLACRPRRRPRDNTPAGRRRRRRDRPEAVMSGGIQWVVGFAALSFSISSLSASLRRLRFTIWRSSSTDGWFIASSISRSMSPCFRCNSSRWEARDMIGSPFHGFLDCSRQRRVTAGSLL